MERFLSRVSNKHFYHFTDKRNLESIREHGILSRNERKKIGITDVVAGGENHSHDDSVGLGNYVHLSFTNNHPMGYLAKQSGRIGDMVILGIKPEIIKIAGALVTLEVANKGGGAERYTPGSVFEFIDWEALYDRMDWKVPAVRQRRNTVEKYEILIPNRVPLDLLVF